MNRLINYKVKRMRTSHDNKRKIDIVGNYFMKKIVQTAGRNALNEFAPQFAHFNDDVLFGENWNNQDIDVKTRCIITVTALITSGMINTSLVHHFENAKAHGVTQKEIAAVITHIAFYAGWPKGWAAFNLAMSAYIRKRMNALLNCQWMQSFYTHSF